MALHLGQSDLHLRCLCVVLSFSCAIAQYFHSWRWLAGGSNLETPSRSHPHISTFLRPIRMPSHGGMRERDLSKTAAHIGGTRVVLVSLVLIVRARVRL